MQKFKLWLANMANRHVVWVIFKVAQKFQKLEQKERAAYQRHLDEDCRPHRATTYEK